MTTFRRPAASVIIPTYNRAAILSHTLQSLTLQTIGSAEFEVIVIDDGSTDETYSVVRSFENVLTISYLYQDDLGNRTGEARNWGISQAKASICIFVDAGMLLSSRCIEEHIRIHQTEERLAVIGYAYGFEEFNELDRTLVELVNTTEPDETIAHLRSNSQFWDLRETNYRRHYDRLEDLPAPWVYFWTCNVSVKRQDLVKVGLFDLNFDLTWGFEDIELAYRLHQDGVKIVLHRPAAAIHYPHGKESSVFKDYCQMRNAQYFHQKHRAQQTALYLRSSALEFNDFLLSLNRADYAAA